VREGGNIVVEDLFGGAYKLLLEREEFVDAASSQNKYKLNSAY